jgi:Zn-dependent protease
LFYASLVNVGLFVFNMIPIPPLDGSVLFERLLPRSWWPTYLRYRQYTMPILLAIVVLNFVIDQNGHTGPLTWLFDEVYKWWGNVLGISTA